MKENFITIASSFNTNDKIINLIDVKEFITKCIEILGAGFHIDTPFEDYITGEHQSVFSRKASTELNKCLEKCFSITSKEQICIYGISLTIMRQQKVI